MSIVTAHQPAYLPWLGYFHKISLSDIFVILDDVQFEKNSFTNRNKIKGPNGDFWLTVPVKIKGHIQKKISDIEISQDPLWKKKHLKAIENCYSKAEFFKRYFSFFEECYSKNWATLAELNHYMLNWFLEQLGIKTKVYKMSDLAFEGKKTSLVLEICKRFNAKTYIFGALGKNYADMDEFNRQNVNVHFQDYKPIEYRQLFGPFVPNLSVVDLLFNHGPRSYDIMLSGNIDKVGQIKSKKSLGAQNEEHDHGCCSAS